MLPVLTAVTLLGIGLPPWRLAKRTSVLLCVYFAGCSMLGALVVAPAIAWKFGLTGAIVGVFLCVGSLWGMATRQFHHLQELIECGDALRAPDGLAPLLWHVTDLHITSSEETSRYEGGPGGGTRWEAFLAQPGVATAAAVIVSGDMTDRGLEPEWDRFLALWGDVPEPKPALILCPGNHDIAGDHYGGETPSRYFVPQGMARFFAVASKLSPQFKTAKGGMIGDMAAHIEREIIPDMEAKEAFLRRQFESWESLKELPPDCFLRSPRPPPNTPTIDAYDWAAIAREHLASDWFVTHWTDAFPLHWHASEFATQFLVLNSCDQAETFGGSGVGSFGAEQLDRLQASLEAIPDAVRHVVVVAHHAVFRPPGQWALPLNRHAIRQLQAFAFLGHRPDETRRFSRLLTDAAERNPDKSFMYCCGHRHAPACGRAGMVLVLEGGSLAEDGTNAWALIEASVPPFWRLRGHAVGPST
jgi:hypothetical protein